MNLLSAHAASALVTDIFGAALLALAAALALRLFPRLAASTRSVVWTAVFALAVALHFLPAAPSHSTPALRLDPRWSVAIVLCWAALSLVRAIQLTRAALTLRSLARTSTPIPNPPWAEPILAGTQLCTSPAIDRPCLAGLGSPRILIPAALFPQLSPAELQQILLHELEHLRRRDSWTNLFARLALVLFPLNPALLWLERRLATERELACDDRVLATTGAPKAYAQCLAHIAQHSLLRRGLSLAVAFLGRSSGRSSELTHRVHRILSRHPDHTSRLARLAAGALLAPLALATFALTTHPQLVSFLPTPPSTFAFAEPAPIHSAIFRGEAHATLLSARMPVAPVVHRPTHIRRQIRKPIDPPTFLTVTTWRTVRQPRATLIEARYTPDTPDPSHPTYAAVPVPNGWLIFLL